MPSPDPPVYSEASLRWSFSLFHSFDAGASDLRRCCSLVSVCLQLCGRWRATIFLPSESRRAEGGPHVRSSGAKNDHAGPSPRAKAANELVPDDAAEDVTNENSSP